MSYSVSDDEIRRIAKDLGIEVSFDNSPDKVGVRNMETGEIRSLESYMTDFLGDEKNES